MLQAPELKDMFPDLEPKERASAFGDYKKALNDAEVFQGEDVVKMLQGIQPGPSPTKQLESLLASGALSKSLSADAIASLQTELTTAKQLQDDMIKDITLTSPLSTGLVAYDLEAPAKFLVPKDTPLRNRIARLPGVGLARKFKRITGLSNAGVGGVANLSPFINDSTTASFGSLTLRRGAKISYAADEKSINYKQMGFSDMVTWSAEFQGRGYEDIRQLSQTALLWASMLGDERAILGARGTDSGFVGAITAPATPTAAARTAGAGETGNSANIANLFVRVTALSMFGETTGANELNSTALSAVTGKVLDVTVVDVTGAVGYNAYAGTTTGNANCFYAGTSGYNVITINFTGGGTGGAPSTGANAPAAGTTASADAYDGFLAVQLDPTQSGYVNRLNAALSTSAPGAEFETAFAALYDIGSGGNLANPDEILINGIDRKQQSEALKAGSTTPGYRLEIVQADVGGVRLGSLVSHIVNEVTGKEVPFTVHPYMPQGNSIIWSHTLPFPDSEVGATVEYHLPQDYMAINWPIIQHTYDIGSYWLGSPVFYAPKWSGAVCGIKKA
jgi:hypothetical protein